MVLMITKCGRKELIENNNRGSGDGDIASGAAAEESSVPPVNFANVEDGVYRSGFPQPTNFRFLETLQLRSIIYLCPEPYPDENLEFLKAHDIRLFQFGIVGTKVLSIDVLRNIITEVLKLLIDVRIHPVLIHCKQGKCGRKELIENNNRGSGDGDIASGAAAEESSVPPVNFANVEDGIYRSGFPQPTNFRFLETLQLRSIIYLCPEPYPDENLEFLKAHDIRLFQFGIVGTKVLSIDVLRNIITEVLKLLIDVRIHPVLIHCKQGKHRTGCVVGSLRKLQNWCLSSVLEEYKLYAGVKSRETDLNFLETYDVSYLQQSLQTIVYQYHRYCSKKQRRLQ